MRAIILAAGRGSRLKAVIGDRPKCLARIGGTTLLERQIRSLQAAGVDAVTVVAGYGANQVERLRCAGVELLHNTRFASTNSLYSLWLARDLLLDGFVVLNGDVLFHPQLLVDLLTARHEDALLVAACASATAFTDEEMKVRIRRGVVTDIAKTLDAGDCDAENIGIARFGPGGAAHLVEALDRIVAAGGVTEWLPRAFADFCRARPLYAIEGRGYPWIEIDFPEDYWRACGDVLPAIEAFAPALTAAPAPMATARTADLGRTSRHV